MSQEKRLSGMSQEKRLSGLSQDKRFSGLSQEKRFSGLSLERKRSSAFLERSSQEQSRSSTLIERPSQDQKRFSSSAEEPNNKRLSTSSQETPKSKRYSGFRPLQLSFYLPGNRLSLLPRFSDDADEDVDSGIPPMPEISRPVTALMKPKPSVISDRPMTFHNIPRKAVGSQTSSVAGGSARSSMQSSVTLNNTLYSRNSMLQDQPRSDSDARLSTTWRNTQDFQKPAPRPVSRIWADAAELLSSARKSTHSIHLQPETIPESPLQSEHDEYDMNECHTISEESSPVSPLSPVSPMTPQTPAAPIKHQSAVAYHDYDFTPATPSPRKHNSAVEYHDYEFGTPTLTPTTPAFSTNASPSRDSTMKVRPLFHAQPPLPRPASPQSGASSPSFPEPKPRSSSGSSTLYHGSISSPADSEFALPPKVKNTLSIAVPSPTINHRLSDWLSRSATGGGHHHHSKSWSPSRKGGEVYSEGGPDSPTLGVQLERFWIEWGREG